MIEKLAIQKWTAYIRLNEREVALLTWSLWGYFFNIYSKISIIFLHSNLFFFSLCRLLYTKVVKFIYILPFKNEFRADLYQTLHAVWIKNGLSSNESGKKYSFYLYRLSIWTKSNWTSSINIELLKTIIEKNRRQIACKFTKQFNLSPNSIIQNFHGLDNIPKFGQWVSHYLTAPQNICYWTIFG